jgi:hypothetical protein
MKKIKRGVTDFDGRVPGDYDPDSILADAPDLPEDFNCEACGDIMVRTGDGFTCPNCHPDMPRPGTME